jgi:hypothetical protein
MNIPDKVKIGGLEYTVLKNTRPCKNNVNVDGEIIYDTGTIQLRQGLEESADYSHFVLIHEIMHGIFDHMCIEQNEELIGKISKGLHMVIKDNPDLFK